MKLWIETLNTTVIRNAADKGVIDGVVLTADLLSKQANPKQLITQTLDNQPGQVIIDLFSHFQEIGAPIAALSPRIVLKIPIIETALEAFHLFSQQPVCVMASGVFSMHQALLAAKLHVEYICVHFLRMMQSQDKPFELLQSICAMMSDFHFPTAVFALHPKTPEQMKECIKASCSGVILKEEFFCEILETHEMAAFYAEQNEKEWKLVTHSFLPSG